MSGSSNSYEYETVRVHPWSKYPWRRSYAVWTLSGITAFLFLGCTSNPKIFASLALSSGDLFRIWQFATAFMTTNNIISLFFYVMLLLCFGVPLEHEWSHRDLALTYVFSGLISSVVLYSVAGQLNGYASPMGAVSGLLAAAMFHMGSQELNLYMVFTLRLRTTVLVIMALMMILCLWSSAVMLVIPVSGFATGLLYCQLQKKMQRREARVSRNREEHICKIEID